MTRVIPIMGDDHYHDSQNSPGVTRIAYLAEMTIQLAQAHLSCHLSEGDVGRSEWVFDGKIQSSILRGGRRERPPFPSERADTPSESVVRIEGGGIAT